MCMNSPSLFPIYPAEFSILIIQNLLFRVQLKAGKMWCFSKKKKTSNQSKPIKLDKFETISLDDIKLAADPVSNQRPKPRFLKQISSLSPASIKKDGSYTRCIPGFTLIVDFSITGCEMQSSSLRMMLKKFKAFSKLVLRSSPVRNGVELASMTPSIKYGNLLTLPRLFVDHSRNMSEQIRNMSAHIEGFQWLSTLELSFSKSHGVSGEPIEVLTSNLSCLANLTTLKLSFYNCDNITNEIIGNLAYSIRHLAFLSTLVLRLHGCQRITNDSILALFHYKKPWTHLTTLVLDFTQCKAISDTGFLKLGNSLKNLTILSALSLTFLHNNLTELCVSSLSSCLSSLKALSHLKVNLRTDATHNSEMAKLFIQKLFLSVNQLVELKTLNLKMISTTYENTKKSMIVPCKSLHNLTSLHELVLDFSKSDEITEGSLKGLFTSLKKLTNLMNLNLNFSSCCRLTAKSTRCLALSFKKLRSLVSLRLDFSDCYFITDENIRVLFLNLVGLTSLSEVTFCFRYCERLTDKSLEGISSSLKYLEPLSRLSLDFDNVF